MNESGIKTGLNRFKTGLKQVFVNFFKELKIELDFFQELNKSTKLFEVLNQELKSSPGTKSSPHYTNLATVLLCAILQVSLKSVATYK